MPHIRLETRIHAPLEVVFDLARSIDTHMVSASQTGERAVAGRTSGLIELDETVTWEARHFGIKQRLTVRITEFDRPHSFTDEMVSGAFKTMHHRHLFATEGHDTVMTDEFQFSAPLGILGRFAEALFLTRYMRRFLEKRNRTLREIAEATLR